MDTNLSISSHELLDHAGWARALARSLVADAASADDLAQDTLLEALQSPPRHRGNVRGWLGRVLRNKLRDRARRERARPAVEEQGRPAVAALAPDVAAAEREERQRLARLVQSLGEPYRSTLLMRYWHGLEPTQIARQLGVPAGTVRWRLKVALDTLRSDLDGDARGDRRAWVLALLTLASRDGGSLAAPATSWVALAASAGLAAAAVAFVATLWRPWAEPTQMAALAAAPGPVEPPSEARALLADAAGGRVRQDAAPRVEPVPASEGEVVVRLRAVDAAGRPIQGARLELTRTTWLAPSRPAGADGVVEYRLPLGYSEPAQPTGFLLRAPGRATVQLAGQDEDGSIELGDVAMAPGGGLSGRVLDPEGRPVAKAWVHARDAGQRLDDGELLQLLTSNGSTSSELIPRRTRADAEGRFVLDGLPVGTWRIAAGDHSNWPSLSEDQQVVAGATRAMEPLRLAPVAAERCISGRVVDAAGKLIGGAAVGFEWRGEFQSGGTATEADANGMFRIVLPTGISSVSLWYEDTERADLRARLDGLRPGASGIELRVVEVSTLALRVRVLGPDGEPAPRSRLRVLRADTPGAEPMNAGFERTDDGVLSVVVSAIPVVLEVDAPGMRMRRLGPFEPAALAEPIECRLAPPPVARGRVAAQGAPAEGARVSLWRQVRGKAVHDGMAVRVEPAPIAEGLCDAQGAFALEVPEQLALALAVFSNKAASGGMMRGGTVGYGEIPPELFGNGPTRPIYVRVERDGFAPLERGPIDLEDVAALDLGDLELSHGGAIEGRVSGVDGAEPAGARVLVSRGDARPRTLTVGDDGRFRFEGLTVGAWDVRLLEPEAEPASGFSDVSFVSVGGFEVDPHATHATCEHVALAPRDDLEEERFALPSDCTVEEGATTTFDLVRRPLPAALELGLFVDGAPLKSARARRLGPDEASLAAGSASDWSEVRFGTLRLTHPEPGPARIAVEGAFDVRLVLDLHLQRGSNSRGLMLATATLDVAGFGSATDLWLVCDAKGALGLRPVEGDVSGLRVPAGRVRVVRAAPGQAPSADSGATQAEIELEAGSQGTLRAP